MPELIDLNQCLNQAVKIKKSINHMHF